METKVGVAQRLMVQSAIARFAGSINLAHSSLGFAPKASLHPRLYADACFAGYGDTEELREDLDDMR